MAVGFRPKLGLNLQSIVAGDQPPFDMGDFPAGRMPSPYPAPPPAPAKPGFFGEGGLGRMLAGAIGDALAQSSGMQPVFAPMQRQQQALKQEEAQWTRRRQAEREDKQWEWANKPHEDDAFTRMMRQAGIDPLGPQGQTMLRQRLDRQTDEPDVVVTLPNGQLYIGPKSGLQAALGGAAAPPSAPVGKLRPLGDGGGNATGGFR